MTYRILKNGTAVISERNVIPIVTETILKFIGATEGDTLILKREDGVKHFTPIEDGLAIVRGSYLSGGERFKVRVSKLQGDGAIVCEGIKKVTHESKPFIAPDDSNIPAEIARLRIENDELRQTNKEILKRLDALLLRVEEFEGFDI